MGVLVTINPGDVFGRWTVIQRTLGSGGHGKKVYYDCVCECGNTKSVCGTSLRNGASKSCGCYNKDKRSELRVDLTGQRFGRLVALYPIIKTENNERTKWHCKCDCGNECDVSLTNLTRTDRLSTQSCGCLQKETVGEMSRKDITGMRSGLLTALYPTDERDNYHGVLWICQCDCGKQIKTSTANITSQHISSCGCATRSKGELKIEELLTQHNISYTEQQRFPSCVSQDTGRQFAFDFYVANSYLIEFDGAQHFFATDSGWNTTEALLQTQSRDRQKNQWCQENNIPLIRIPYTQLKNLCIEDLQLETTAFRVV